MADYEKNMMLRDLEPDVGKVQKKKTLYKKRLQTSSSATQTAEEKTFELELRDWLKEHRNGGTDEIIPLDELIPFVCNYLKHNQAAKLRRSYDWIIVDEYQDLNPAAQEFVELLL